MGWTGINYNEKKHSEFEEEQARDLIQENFVSSRHKVAAMYFKKDRTNKDRHEIYLVMESHEGERFIMVVLVSIENNQLCYKEIDESSGSAYKNCPVMFLKLSPKSYGNYSINWRADVYKNNNKAKPSKLQFYSYF